MSDIPPQMRWKGGNSDQALYEEVVREMLGKTQKDMRKIGKQELKAAVKSQKEWNSELKEFVKMNDKAAADLGKGFQDLNKATQEGLQEVGEKVEELSMIAKASAPAITQLANALKGKTLLSQIELTQSLMDLSQSEGVQGVVKFLTNLMNQFLKGSTDVVKFATDISNILGNFVESNVDLSPFKAMFDQIDETSVNILETVSSIIVQLIEKIAENPTVFKVLERMVQAMIGGLKAVEEKFLLFDAAVTAIDDWTKRILGKWGYAFDFQYLAAQGIFIEGNDPLDNGQGSALIDSDGDGISDYDEHNTDLSHLIKPDLDDDFSDLIGE